MFGGGGGSGTDGEGSKRPFIIAVVLLIGLWLASGIYRVDADEQGVVLRFGQFERISEPGLNYHLPFPVEVVYTPRVTSINREEIGFRSRTGTEDVVNVPEESLMLTGDKNLVSTQFEVQWRIKDAVKYLFNLRTPESMVKPVAETSMREVMGNTSLSQALSDNRQAIANDTQQLMQGILNEYESGIEIYEVNLLAVDAPEPVVDAFIEVLAAQQEKETLQNEAKKYRDRIIPVAEGKVDRMLQEAKGYREAVISRAQGQAARFDAIYGEYARSKAVTRRRIYLETMEELFSGMTKMIVDGKSGSGVLPYLPLPELRKAPAASGSTQPQGGN
jgi:membrane protease subunit HflK